MNAIEQIRQIARARVAETQSTAELQVMQQILKATALDAYDESDPGKQDHEPMSGAVD